MLSLSPLSVCRVESAGSIEAALWELDKTQFDVVVLDLNLPDSKGLDTLARIRKTFPEVAIVVNTGQYDENIGLSAITQGAQEYIVKGHIDPYQLTKSLCYAIERKQAEQQLVRAMNELENSNRELQDFAHIVSHDLKAPLRGVKTLATFLQEDNADTLDERSKENLEMLCQRVDHMQSLIRGVLQYAKVGRKQENPDHVDLNALVPEVIELVALPGNIELQVQDNLPIITGDTTRVSQVFANLLSNAIKYMDKPQGHLEVGCVKKGAFWVFNVTDNGPGIKEKDHKRIFKIFQTLSCRDEAESSGVGLSIVQRIVESCGGRIWVESELGQGSSFFFTWPTQQGVGRPAARNMHT